MRRVYRSPTPQHTLWCWPTYLCLRAKSCARSRRAVLSCGRTRSARTRRITCRSRLCWRPWRARPTSRGLRSCPMRGGDCGQLRGAMTEFRSAAEVGAGFHAEVIAPLLGDVGYAAGLLGWGSDVLGYDTARSMDHGWGPRLVVLVDEADVAQVRQTIDAGLPDSYEGFAVRFGWDSYEPTHHVTVATLGDWLRGWLGFDASQGIGIDDWLVTPQQQLLGVVAGRVYADDGRLAPVRAALAWYPDQIWRWMLACQWSRIAQEEAFVQRTHEVGDELGSRVVTGRLVRDLMRLALLQSRTYAPYTKWLGTAFARLGHPDGLDGPWPTRWRPTRTRIASGRSPRRTNWWPDGTTRWGSPTSSTRCPGRTSA